MRADSAGTGNGTVNFVRGDFQCECANPSKVDFSKSTGKVTLFYNPPDGYNTAIDFVGNGHVRVNPTVPNQFIGYMLVNNSNDLQAINQNKFTLTQNYALGSNIEASTFEGWTPIGNISTPFSGRLNGLGNTISGLTIAPTNSTVSSIGLFGVLGSTAVVQDLKLADFTVKASPGLEGPGQFVGTLAGQNFGQVVNVTATGTVDGRNLSGVIAGGLVGQNGGDPQSSVTALIDQSRADVNVSVGNGLPGSNGGWNTAGGLVGLNDGTISNSHATGDVSAHQPADNTVVTLGGLAGANNGEIKDSYATGNVFANNGFVFAGGFVGSNSGVITNTPRFDADGNRLADASGNVTLAGTATGVAGGFAGVNVSFIDQSVASGAVSAGDGAFVGGFAGWSAGLISQSSASGAATGGNNSAVAGFVALNVGEIRTGAATGAVTGGDNSTVGGLVAINFGIPNFVPGNADGAQFTLFQPGLITQSFATGPVTGGDGSFVGGLVALNLGTISQSFASGAVTGGADSSVGGLVAVNFGLPDLGPGNASFPQFTLGTTGAISQAYATGAVTGGPNSTVGGLVAFNGGTIDQTYSIGKVTGGPGSTLGGLVAVNSASFNLPTLPTVPSDSAGVASDSVSVTSASGSRQLAGSQQLASAAVTGTVTNSYWDVTTSGLSTSAAGDPFPTSGGLPPGFVPNPWTENTPNFPCLAGLPCTQVARPIPTPDLPPPPPPPPV